MQWLKGNYDVLHRGASGGTADPEGWELYTGGQDPTWRQLFKPHEVNGADFHAAQQTYKRAPARGRAASVPPEVAGVLSNDRSHVPALDGHRDSAISSHPDGLYAQNTAVTTDHSLGANSAIHRGPYPGGGLLPVAVPDYTLITSGEDAGTIKLPARGETTSRLFANRAGRSHLAEQPELLVKAETEVAYRWRSVLERDWSAAELGLGAMGVYMAFSALA